MDQLFAYSIAPVTKDLPNIIRYCTPSERQAIFLRARAKVQAGKWTGSKLNGKRPILWVKTERSKEEHAQGLRSSTPSRGFHNGICIVASHAFLCMNGWYPTEQKNVASHLCHNRLCVDIEHLEWSSASDNQKREFCRRNKQCTCGLARPCIFTCE